MSALQNVIQRMYEKSVSPFATKTLSYMARDVARGVSAEVMRAAKKGAVDRESVKYIFWDSVLSPLNVADADITEVIVDELVNNGGLEDEFEEFVAALVKDLAVTVTPESSSE